MRSFSEDVYMTLWGELLEGYRVKGVPNLFEANSFCEQQYYQMLDAYERLRERLGSDDEDKDVEQIIDSLLSICREVSLQMFECGKRLG